MEPEEAAFEVLLRVGDVLHAVVVNPVETRHTQRRQLYFKSVQIRCALGSNALWCRYGLSGCSIPTRWSARVTWQRNLCQDTTLQEVLTHLHLCWCSLRHSYILHSCLVSLQLLYVRKHPAPNSSRAASC